MIRFFKALFDKYNFFIQENRITFIVILLLLLFVVIFLAPRIFIVIPAGHAGVFFNTFFGGVETTHPIHEGFHIIAPWNHITIYDMRIQQLPISYNVLTKQGLNILIRLTVRFKPKYDTIGLLHQKIGSKYKQQLIIPVIESSVRTAVGEKPVDELFSARTDVINVINSRSELILNQNYISLNEVLIREIILPSGMQAAILEKEVLRQKLESYVYKIQTEREETLRKEIEAIGWRNFNNLIDSTLTGRILQWQGIEATNNIATSNNSKVVLIGGGAKGLPVILGSDYMVSEPNHSEKTKEASKVDVLKKIQPLNDLEKRQQDNQDRFIDIVKLNNPVKKDDDAKKNEKESIKSKILNIL